MSGGGSRSSLDRFAIVVHFSNGDPWVQATPPHDPTPGGLSKDLQIERVHRPGQGSPPEKLRRFRFVE